MTSNEIAALLWGAGAIQIAEDETNGFKLRLHQDHPDAPLSLIYLNIRKQPKGSLNEKILCAIGYSMADYLATRSPEVDYDYIVGIPNAGISLANGFHQSPKCKPCGLLILKKEETEKGRRIVPAIYGDYEAGGRVLVIDDAVNWGATSKIEVIDIMQHFGLIVNDCMVVTDLEQGGAEDLKKKHVELYYLLTLSSMLDFYEENRLITDSWTVKRILERSKQIKQFVPKT